MTAGALRSVVLAGGGTAGHVSPMLALADELTRRNPGVAVTCVGTETGLEARIVPERGYPLAMIPRVPLPRRPSMDLVRLPGRMSQAVRTAARILDESDAQVAVGFGGYVSTPVYLAARRRGIPIVVHEQNARPGLANRVGARCARSVAVTFPGTSLPGAVVTGMPLRREIAALDRAQLRDEARRFFGLGEGTVLLVTGGSLGAQRLNDAFAASAEDLSAAGVSVLHATGRGKGFVPPTVSGAPYVVVEYLDRMDLAYAAADVVVARAGASTVCELTAVGLPAIYVPLAIGNGEQRLNAEGVVRSGGGLMVDNAAFTAQWIRQTLLPLLLDDAALARMGAASAAAGVRDGDTLLASMVEGAIR